MQITLGNKMERIRNQNWINYLLHVNKFIYQINMEMSVYDVEKKRKTKSYFYNALLKFSITFVLNFLTVLVVD